MWVWVCLGGRERERQIRKEKWEIQNWEEKGIEIAYAHINILHSQIYFWISVTERGKMYTESNSLMNSGGLLRLEMKM